MVHRFNASDSAGSGNDVNHNYSSFCNVAVVVSAITTMEVVIGRAKVMTKTRGENDDIHHYHDDDDEEEGGGGGE